MGLKPLFKKKKTPGIVSVLIITLLIAIGVLGYLVFKKIINFKRETGLNVTKAITTPAGDIIFRDAETGKAKERLNILIVGLDEGRDQRGMIHHKGSRTDTIFLLGVDKKADRLSMLSIPRDTWIYINEKHGENKINSAYGEAFWDEWDASGHDYAKSKAAGITQVKRSVEQFLEVGVDYYIIVKIQTAKDLVDAIGGITVDVEKTMDYDDNWGNLHIHLKKGEQKLSGTQAVGYARFRHDEEGDWGRIRRQQQVMRCLIHELKKPENILKMEEIAAAIKKNVDTNMDINQLIDLAKVYKSFDPTNLTKGIIVGEDKVIDGTMVIIPDKKMKDRLVSRIIRDPSFIEIQDQWVRVLNGCGVQGLGSRTAEKLKEQGYNVVEVDNCPEKTPRETTEIIDHYGNNAGFERLKEGLKLSTAKRGRGQTKESGTTLDYTIILGKDILAGKTPAPEASKGTKTTKSTKGK